MTENKYTTPIIESPNLSTSQERDLFDRWNNPSLIIEQANRIKGLEEEKRADINGLVEFLQNTHVRDGFALSQIEPIYLNNIATIAARPSLINAAKPLLTLYNSLVYSNSKNVPIYVAIFNKYIALKDREIYNSQRNKLEENVSSQEELKTRSLEAVMGVKNRFSVSHEISSDQPIVSPSGSITPISQKLHESVIDLGSEKNNSRPLS